MAKQGGATVGVKGGLTWSKVELAATEHRRGEASHNLLRVHVKVVVELVGAPPSRKCTGVTLAPDDGAGIVLLVSSTPQDTMDDIATTPLPPTRGRQSARSRQFQ